MSIADLCRACGVMGIGLGLLAAPAWAHWEKDSAHYTASEISSQQDAGLLASVPVGTVIMWPGTEAPGPAGHWLKLDGSTFDAAKYPDLARILGGNRLPDGRGVFMVGVQPGEQLGERLAADAGEHNHLLATKTVTSPKPAAAPLPPPPAVDTDEPGTPDEAPNRPATPDLPQDDGKEPSNLRHVCYPREDSRRTECHNVYYHSIQSTNCYCEQVWRIVHECYWQEDYGRPNRSPDDVIIGDENRRFDRETKGPCS